MANVRMIISAFCFGVFSLVSTAHAQHPLILQKLKEWNAASPQPSQEVLLTQVKSAVARIYPENGRCLAQGVQIVFVQPATAERYVFKQVAFGRLRNAWTVTVRHEGCDPAPVRYMIMQGNTGQMNIIRVNRGVSYAHDSLIGDALPSTMLAAHSILVRSGIDCPKEAESKLGIARIEKEEADLGPDVFGIRYSGSWTEVWPIEKCGRVVEVPVRFTADGDGGAHFNSQGSRAVLLPVSAKKDERAN